MSELSQNNQFDVIVIEKHNKFGGYSHSFSRKGKYTWDVGVHYVGPTVSTGASISPI